MEPPLVGLLKWSLQRQYSLRYSMRPGGQIPALSSQNLCRFSLYNWVPSMFDIVLQLCPYFYLQNSLEVPSRKGSQVRRTQPYLFHPVSAEPHLHNVSTSGTIITITSTEGDSEVFDDVASTMSQPTPHTRSPTSCSSPGNCCDPSASGLQPNHLRGDHYWSAEGPRGNWREKMHKQILGPGQPFLTHPLPRRSSTFGNWLLRAS